MIKTITVHDAEEGTREYNFKVETIDGIAIEQYRTTLIIKGVSEENNVLSFRHDGSYPYKKAIRTISGVTELVTAWKDHFNPPIYKEIKKTTLF